MKRFHVHVSVDGVEANIKFYSTVFGAPPSVVKPDYAKWMLDDLRINFAISKRGLELGVEHLGLQVESDTELSALRQQVAAAEIAALDQAGAVQGSDENKQRAFLKAYTELHRRISLFMNLPFDKLDSSPSRKSSTGSVFCKDARSGCYAAGAELPIKIAFRSFSHIPGALRFNAT